LAREHVDQPPLRLLVVAVHQAEVACVTILRHRPADDDLEVAGLLGPVADVAAVEPNHDPPLRVGEMAPVDRAAVDEARPLVAEFRLGPLGHPHHVFADGGGVDRLPDGQDVSRHGGRGGIGCQRGPSGLEIEPLRRDVVGEKLVERRDGRRSVLVLAPAAMEAWAGQADRAEQGAEHDRVAALGSAPPSAAGAAAVSFDPG
jgi:hypothetical protein